jgi:hypothetical protein
MRLVRSIVILSFLFIVSIYGQESRNTQPQDTSTIRSKPISRELSIINLPDLFQPSLSFAPVYRLSLIQPSLELGVQTFSLKSPERIDLTSQWQYELASQEELRTMQMILGTVEFGGVAYLAYRHLKKYGLK